MYACMYVLMYVCVYVCTHVCMCVCSQAELAFMHERDRIRLEGLIPKAVQCDPLVSSIAIQTEFITPDVSPCVRTSS
jgi:hypothetical protein